METQCQGREVPSVFSSWIRPGGALLLLTALVGCGEAAPGPQADGEGEAPAVTEGVASSADGVAIHYEVRGTGDPTLVLVHGWANSMATWGEHPQTLSARHRVVTLEVAGHGRSGADREDWTMGAFGDDVVAVVDDLGAQDVVLVGFSMGGAVVIEAARRLGDRALGVVLVDVFHDPNVMMTVAEAEEFQAAIRANWRSPDFVRAFAFMPDAPDSLIDHVVRQMPEEPYEHLFAALGGFQSWSEFEFERAVRAVDQPIAAINAAQPPTNVEAMQQLAPSFSADTISGVGHGGILLRRVEDFDALLLGLVDQFASGG
jgi:pimeloyl-ACP methyl ester carboxylesterase